MKNLKTSGGATCHHENLRQEMVRFAHSPPLSQMKKPLCLGGNEVAIAHYARRNTERERKITESRREHGQSR
mgnify:CR=1 FL=1